MVKKKTNKAPAVPAWKERQAKMWDELNELIVAYSEACRADETKGGGDPNDYDVIEAEHTLAQLKLEAHITKMRREFET